MVSQVRRVENIAVSQSAFVFNQRFAQENISRADFVGANDGLCGNEAFDVPAVVAESVENFLAVFVHFCVTNADNDGCSLQKFLFSLGVAINFFNREIVRAVIIVVNYKTFDGKRIHALAAVNVIGNSLRQWIYAEQ